MYRAYAPWTPGCGSTWASAGAWHRCWKTTAGRMELHGNGLLFSLPGTPGVVLRGRDRHGRQHLPGRPRRGAHAHAVVGGPQRGILPGQSAAALPARDHRSRVPQRDHQRGSPGGQPAFAAVVDAAHHRPAAAVHGLRPGRHALFDPGKPAHPGLRARLRRRAHPGGGQPLALRAVRRGGPLGPCRAGARGGLRPDRIPARGARTLRADHGTAQLLLVLPGAARRHGPPRPTAARPCWIRTCPLDMALDGGLHHGQRARPGAGRGGLALHGRPAVVPGPGPQR